MTMQSYYYAPLCEDDEAPTSGKPSLAFIRLTHAYVGKPKKPHVTYEEERTLIENAQRLNCGTSMNRLIESHNGFLVNAVARGVAHTGAEEMKDDFYNEAVLGFMTAVKNFDLNEHKTRLSALAKYYVVGAVRNYELKFRSSFTYGRNVYDRRAYFGLGKIMKTFKEVHGREMQKCKSDYLMAALLTNTTAKAIERAVEIRDRHRTLPFEAIQVVDHAMTTRPEAETIRKRAAEITVEYINSYAATLSKRDADVLLTIAADPTEYKARADELAVKYGRTTERIRQIYRKGLEGVRRNLADRGITQLSDVA